MPREADQELRRTNQSTSLYFGFIQPFVVPMRCVGQFLRIRILSNFGDKHYVGLNGIQIFDSEDEVLLDPTKVSFKLFADPSMAASSSGVEDKRVPENLYNGVNSGEHFDKFFLMPFVNPRRLGHPTNLGREFSQILIFFEDYHQLGKISFWNYSKTFSRAAKDVEIFLDESLVFTVYIVYLGLIIEHLSIFW